MRSNLVKIVAAAGAAMVALAANPALARHHWHHHYHHHHRHYHRHWSHPGRHGCQDNCKG